MSFAFTHAIKESLRRKFYYVVCLFACFLVTLVSLVSKTVVTQGSLIFLMLAEKETGEMDIIISPAQSTRNISNTSTAIPSDYFYDYAFINYTKYLETNTTDEWDDTSTMRIIYNGYTTSKSVNLILINTTKEQQIEIGRSAPFPKLNISQCIVHKSLTYNIVDPTKLEMSIDMNVFLRDSLLNYFYMNQSEYNDNITRILNITTDITFTCDVVDTFMDNYGKAGDESDGLVFMEHEHFFTFISEHLPNDINEMFPTYKHLLTALNPNDYANTIIVNFPPNRISAYVESDYDMLVQKGAEYANKLVTQFANLVHLNVTMPLIERMEQYNFGSVLLNLTLNIIIISLFILSLILIYSLLLITMETNSFEFGILRLIGTTKRDIVLIVILQCLSFSIPAFALAFAAHFVVLDAINYSLQSYIHSDLQLTFSTGSLVLALVMNFLSPICAAFFPIRSILGKNIATSLNSTINKTTGMKIEVVNIEIKETQTLIVFGSLTFIYGASIYYFLPLALISYNFSLIGFIFLFILIGILLGMVLLSLNIENILQKVITYILLFFTKSYTKQVIVKNLTAHRLKNRKTSLMYSISVGLFILTSVGLDNILLSAKKEIMILYGSEVTLRARHNYITPRDIKDTLVEIIDKGAITAFAFQSGMIDDLCYHGDSSVVNLGKSLTFSSQVRAISPLFFNATNTEDLKVASWSKYSYDNINNISPSEILYYAEAKGKVGLSGIFEWEFKANTEDPFYIQLKRQTSVMNFINKAAYIINSASGLQVNSEPSMQIRRATLFNIPHYIDMLYKCQYYFAHNISELHSVSYDDFPIDRVHFVLNKTMNVNEAINIISSAVAHNKHYKGRLWFYNNLSARIDMITKMIFQIFYVVSAVVLVFCFFNLAASMTINIFDQKKEIAIYRALGMTQRHVAFVFVVEAVVLILASSLIGMTIGSLIAYTMSLQWQMFMNITVKFAIPGVSLAMVIGFSIVGGVVSTILPSMRMMKIAISDLIRNA